MLPYLQLLRIPNLFTALADVMMGFLFVHQSLWPLPEFLSLLVASGLLYSAGMVLNDLFDVRQDAIERPDRPLPSGKISKQLAAMLGYGMLLVGVAVAFFAGNLAEPGTLRSGYVAMSLAGCVFAYDALLKRSMLGPVAMGCCRGLNVLLGMSTAIADPDSIVGFTAAQLCVAGGIAVYIMGVTWFARTEAYESNRASLGFGIVVMFSGFFLLGFFPQLGDFAEGTRKLTLPLPVWQLLIAWLGILALRRCCMALIEPTPSKVQAAVKTCILSLIVMDAAVCLVVCSPWWWSALILLLLIPTLTLGRWVYST